MRGRRFNVLKNGTVVAEKMRFDDAIILVKALIKEYLNALPLKVSIEEMAPTEITGGYDPSMENLPPIGGFHD